MKKKQNMKTTLKTAVFALALSTLCVGMCAQPSPLAGVIAGGRQASSSFSPSDISGLKLWLKADGSVYNAGTTQATNGQTVAEWVDASASGWNATQATETNKPTFVTGAYNGRPCVRFDGVDNTMTLAGAFGILRNVSAGTIVACVKLNSATAGEKDILSITRNGSTTSARLLLAVSVTTSGRWGGGGRRLDANGFVGVESTGAASTASPVIAEISADYANSNLFMYLGGSLESSTTSFQTDGNTSDTDSGAVRLGGLASSTFASVDVLEVCVFNVVLTAPQRASLTAYLAARWQ